MEYIISALWFALECVAFFLIRICLFTVSVQSQANDSNGVWDLRFVAAESESPIAGACASAVRACLWSLSDRFSVSGAAGAASVHRFAGLYPDCGDGCNRPFRRVHGFAHQSGRTGLEKGECILC